jgi:hypothetical protein
MSALLLFMPDLDGHLISGHSGSFEPKRKSLTSEDLVPPLKGGRCTAFPRLLQALRRDMEISFQLANILRLLALHRMLESVVLLLHAAFTRASCD